MISRQLLKRITGFVFLVSVTLAGNASEAITTTSQPGAFLKQQKADADTLVILDLDDTTITTPEGQWLGRSEMFYDYLGREKKQFPNKTDVELAERIDPLLMAVYEKVPVILTDSLLPEQLHRLISQGVTVIAMTARGKKVKEVTLEQLNRTGVQFSDLGESRWINLDAKRKFRVERSGVVFVSHGNKKGEVLLKLFNDGVLDAPSHIYFIDDREKHLFDVAEMLKKYNQDIKLSAVFCTYLQGKKKYDANEADEQLYDFLIKHKNDSSIYQLIRADEYTRKVMSRCADSTSKRWKQCKSILNSNDAGK